MASVLPSCIGNTFCSHRQAAFFLLATLIPFFSPFLVLCLPFLILFLAPMSFLVCFLLLLNMLQVSLRSSCWGKGAVRPRTGLEKKTRAEEAGERRKCEGLPESGESEGSKGQSMAASGVEDAKDLHTIPAGFSDLLSVEHDDAKELDVRHEMEEKDKLDARHGVDEKQEELHGVDEKQEERHFMDEIVDKREEISSGFSRGEAEEEGLEVLPSSSAESLKEDQEAIVKGMPPDQEEKPMRYEDLHTIPAGFSNLLSVEHDDAKELDVRHEKDEEELDARHGMDEKQEELHGMDEKQEELNLLEETVEKSEKISSGFGRGEAEEEGLEVLPSSSTESAFYRPKEDQEATVKRMPSDQEEKPMRPEEEQATREGTDDSEDHLKDKLHFKTTLPAGLEKEILTEFPSTHEHGLPRSPSIEAPSIAYHPCDIPDEEQGHDSSRDLPDEEQGHDSSRDLPDAETGVVEPTEEFYEVPGKLPGTEPDVHESRDKFDEVPSKDTSSNRTSEIETHLVSGEPLGQEPPLSTEKQSGSGHLSDLEKQDLLTLKKEVEGVEPHGSSSSDHIERVAAETFAEELQDDEKPQLLQDTEHFQEGMSASSMDASFQLDAAEQDSRFKRGSSTASPPQRPIESVGIQDTMQEEQRILADIDAIKKIVGYEGDIHASVMEQITSLYLFLGMEPYWDAEVEDLESARREVEVLKVVVGVK